tara:strand:+ start:558 stop:7427 length:6870 start_codon:yes stop_codon:yes gene_type:complete
MSNYRRRLAGALVLLMLLAPITNAATTSWAGPSTVNTAGGSTTLTGFRAPGNATIMDGWAHVTDSPMAASLTPATEMDISVLENGTSLGTTTEYREGNLTLVDDGTLNDITQFDNYNYSISLDTAYKLGPGSIARIAFESSAGYTPHPSCNGLKGYNLTSGYDDNGNGILDSSEISHVDYLCTTNQTIQGGNGAVSNGTVVNGSFLYNQVALNSGNSTCPLGGISMSYGNDYGNYYDGDTSLNSTETDGTLYFCNRDTYWSATNFDFNGSVNGQEQTMSYGVVPSSASEGRVSLATKPGEALPAGVDTWLNLPIFQVPPVATRTNYYFSFDHWFHLDSSEAGAWLEYKIPGGDWNWFATDGGYPSSIDRTDIVVNGAPSGNLPVFTGATYSGWQSETLNLTTFFSDPTISSANSVEFRFRVWTSNNSSLLPGWFIDDIQYYNAGTGNGFWHHGCDVEGSYTSIVGTGCYYSNNALGYLTVPIDLYNVSALEFDVHWDLEGSVYDNACIELSSNNGQSWTDISSTGSSATQCRSRSGNIPGSSGYADKYGNIPYIVNNGFNYYDDSGGEVTILNNVPVANQVNGSLLRFVVQTDTSVQYGQPGGNSDAGNNLSARDGREGFTVYGYRTMANNTTLNDFSMPGTASVSGQLQDWQYLCDNCGFVESSHAFEDSEVSAPPSNYHSGFYNIYRQSSGNQGACNSERCDWRLSEPGSFGPERASSFPYMYKIGLNGGTDAVYQSSLVTPIYTVSGIGESSFSFDMNACMDYGTGAYVYVGGALWMKVNGGQWQHVDMPSYTDRQYSTTSASYTVNDGLEIWTRVHCNTNDWDSYEVDLSDYKGDDVQFKFAYGGRFSDGNSGWHIDNVGIKMGNFSQSGTWSSPSFSISGENAFNRGIIEIDGTTDDYANNTLTGSLIDATSGASIPGYSNLDFPISLAGLDSDTYPLVKLTVDMDTTNPLSTPMLEFIRVGGNRLLTADMMGLNGWQMTNVEVIDGLINATNISGTISSDYIHSVRPIKALSFGGNSSVNVQIEVRDESGNSIGSSPKGGSVVFATPRTGYSLHVTLPTNGYIDRLQTTHLYGEPASNVEVDFADDGNLDWSFPNDLSRGHYAWQTKLLGSQSDIGYLDGSRSITMQIGSTPSTAFAIIPTSGSVNGGLVSLVSDSDGFESPVDISIAGATFSTGSAAERFTSEMNQYQISGINSLASGWTDTETDRDWRVVEFSLSSTQSQTVTLTGLAIGYTMFENVSDISTPIADYHTTISQADPPPVEIAIPVTISSSTGSISVAGDLVYDFIMTNRDFQVPNTLYPDGVINEIETAHHHLNDNSLLNAIELTGSASDGQIIAFRAENGNDGLWGQGSDPVTISQTSGSSVAPLDVSQSYVEIVTHSDGYDDVVVNWMFDVNWNWDDVESIRWVSTALDENGEFVWPAVSFSGQGSSKAVENDLQLESFEVRDEQGRLLSNQFSTFYPFPVKSSNDIMVSGTVRFQDASDSRPQPSDFLVGLNMSGALYPMTMGENGSFETTVDWLISATSNEQTLSPLILTVGPSGSTVGAEDTSGTPPQTTVIIDSSAPIAGPLQVNTPTGLQDAHGKVWDPTVPLSLYVTIDESEARGESITLKYWRGSSDDVNMDGIADESEYLGQTLPLSSGMTGQQQVNFIGIDVSAQDFNSPVHMFIEGTDWAGLTYQEGGTGGSAGASNSWASVIVATDEPTSIPASGYSMNAELGYLMAGHRHTFSMQIDEPNGIETLDNVTIMLCGDGPSNAGKMSYDPSRGVLWSAPDSMVTPLSVQTQSVTAVVTELSIDFEISWDYVWEDGQPSCKPSVSILDDLNTVAYQNNIGELSWLLDNQFLAIPDSMTDLTSPMMDQVDDQLFLRQGDEFIVTGSLMYAGSGMPINSIPDDLRVEAVVIYGSQQISSETELAEDSTFSITVTLPDRVPLDPTMAVSLNVLNVPGLGGSTANSDYSIVVDSRAPTALFDQLKYPDSSLTIIESDMVDDVKVTVTMNDQIGMQDGPLQVSWVYMRGNSPVTGTEDSGELMMILEGDRSSSSEWSDVYQSRLDLTPQNGMSIEAGDSVSFWITSTDKAGNEVSGLGSESIPRAPALRIMEFIGEYVRAVSSPSAPLMNEIVTIETFWENTGKRDGTLVVGLYELIYEVDENGQSSERWKESLTTAQTPNLEIPLEAEATSVRVTFRWEATSPGQPNLYIVTDIDGDGSIGESDFNAADIAIGGISVVPPPPEDEGSSDSAIMMIGAIAAIAVAAIGFLMSRKGSEDDVYYDDDDYEYYEEDDEN